MGRKARAPKAVGRRAVGHEQRVVFLGGRDRYHRQVAARCACGFAGPWRAKMGEVRLDVQAHVEGWQNGRSS